MSSTRRTTQSKPFINGEILITEAFEEQAKRILGIEYYHDTQLAPNKEILDGYKDKAISWEQYETNFLALLKQRDPKRVGRMRK